MCGIAGYLGFREDGLIERMLRMTRHRGPDASASWNDPEFPIALGHNRLSILDLSDQGRQPMWDESGRFCITYNGEIYNYLELRRRLESKGYRFRSNTDTEVLLNLFHEKGISCLRDLTGIWAFAIWDSVERVLYVSRDPLGIKPFYYVVDGLRFLFASEIKSLLCWEGLSRQVDEKAIYETILYLWTPGPGTIFKQVRKLLPGQTMTIKRDRPPRIVDEIDFRPDHMLDETSEDALIDRIREQVLRSVQSQLVSDVPVGAFLSGGLDSSAVVAMSEKDGHRISHCYTIDYAGGRPWEGMVNDLQYARKVAHRLGVDCIEIPLEDSILERTREMIWHLDEPQADLAPLNVLLIAEAARANGDYVLLSGAGGDDIFSGYRRHIALKTEGWWDWMPVPVRSVLRRGSESLHASNPLFRRLKRMFSNADRTRSERLIRYFAWGPEAGILNLFQDDIRERLQRHDPFEVMSQALAKGANGMDPLNRMLFLDTRFFLADHNLNYTDKMGMARGIEIRVPLIDLELVRMAFGIPGTMKQKGLTGKYLFKRAMETYLPRDVIYRPKTGFVAPVREWMMGPLRERVRSVLSREAVNRRGWFSWEAINRLSLAMETNREDAHYILLSVYMIEEWARLFIDGEGRHKLN